MAQEKETRAAGGGTGEEAEEGIQSDRLPALWPSSPQRVWPQPDEPAPGKGVLLRLAGRH